MGASSSAKRSSSWLSGSCCAGISWPCAGGGSCSCCSRSRVGFEMDGFCRHEGQKSQLRRVVMLARVGFTKVAENDGIQDKCATELQESLRLLQIVEDALSSSRSSFTSNGMIWDGRCVGTKTNGHSHEEPASSSSEAKETDSVTDAMSRLPTSMVDMEQRLLGNTQLHSLLSKMGTLEIDTPAVSREPSVSGKPITVLFTYSVRRQDLLGALPEEVLSNGATLEGLQQRLYRFMNAADESYLDTIYHNKVHGADVMMMMHWLFQSVYMQMFFTPIDHLMSLLAAGVHDLGHDGVTNLFHVKTQSHLALRYNDRSVLENMHAALAFELMREHEETNWLSMLNAHFQMNLSEKAVNLQAYVRKGMTEMILMTDATNNGFVLRRMKEQFIDNPATHPHDELKADGRRNNSLRRRGIEMQQSAAEADRKTSLLSALLHAADVSGPVRPQALMLHFTRLILSEFWAQGDEEKRLGLEVSPLCDRSQGMMTVPQGQLGFVNFLVQPLYKQISLVLDEVKEACDQLACNVAFWTERKQEQASFQDIWTLSPRKSPPHHSFVV